MASHQVGGTNAALTSSLWNAKRLCASPTACFPLKVQDENERKMIEASGSFALPHEKDDASRRGRCPSELVLAVSNRPLPETNLLRRSAAALGVPLGTPHLPRGSQALRRGVYARTLSNLEACPNTALLLVDGFDTFLRCNASEIGRRVRAFGTGAVVVSGERLYSFQPAAERPQWDAMAERGSKYRYVNGGGIGGTQAALMGFMRAAALRGPPPFSSRYGMRSAISDQGPVAETVFRDHTQGARGGAAPSSSGGGGLGSRLDYETGLFYTVSGPDAAHPPTARARIAKADPCLVHVPNGHFRTLLRALWNETGPVRR